MEELFSDKHSTNYTYRSLDAATGEYIWLNCSAYSVDQPDGSQLAYALFTDATEQKEREFRYQNAISEYLTANPNALATIRLNLTADKFVSGQSYAIYDGLLADCKTASDFLHRLLRDICRNNTGDNFKNDLSRDSLLQRYREGTSELEFEFKYRFKSTTRWASCFINMIQNPTTHDVEAILYTMDVEESVKNREIIQHISGSDCDFVALINVTDRTRVFYSIKGMAADIFPTEAEDYYTSVDKFHLDGGYEDPDEDINNKVKLESIIDALEKDDEYTFTFPRYKADGEERIELLQFSYLDESRTEVVENATDITASFKQQQAHVNELNAALTEARNANAAKSDFLSRVSHDIRTPMNVIHGMTEFALADIGNEEKLREDLRKIQIANTFLLSLINDILDLSRIESGRIKLQLEPYKYSDFIANITGMFKPLCDEKGLTFTVHSQGDPDDIIVVDKVRLNQTVLNLLSNSVKYTPAGGKIDFFAGKENTRGNMTDVYFIVKDNGIGMSPDFQEHMFEAFTQDPRVARASTSDQGTGLGLSIVEKLVNLMGGTISVESKLDEGTTFSVRYHVPFTRKSVPAAEDDVKTSYAPAYQGNGRRILIAEDNALNAEITKRILEQAGYQVDMAENGEAAVNCFENSAIDCYSAILMDIQMPVMNGMEATRAIRNMNRPDAGTIPIIAATANAYSEDVEKCIKAGMNDHVAKPIDSQALYKKLYDIITKNEPQL
jgi:signal transduction histidine kinase/ActR/RegA family two-component response regulator